MDETTRNALIAYFRRQKGLEQPDGKRDERGCWQPTWRERERCCRLILAPNVYNTDILLRHCCSIEHVANLHDIDAARLRALAVEVSDSDAFLDPDSLSARDAAVAAEQKADRRGTENAHADSA